MVISKSIILIIKDRLQRTLWNCWSLTVLNTTYFIFPLHTNIHSHHLGINWLCTGNVLSLISWVHYVSNTYPTDSQGDGNVYKCTNKRHPRGSYAYLEGRVVLVVLSLQLKSQFIINLQLIRPLQHCDTTSFLKKSPERKTKI